MEQDTHARKAIGIADQPDDLEHHLPLQSSGKSLRKLLQSPGLIANCLSGERQDLLFEGIKFLRCQVG